MTDEQKLISIKNHFIKNLNSSMNEYIYEFIREDGSSEGERNLEAQESLVYTFKELLITHFPELNISDLVNDAKKNAIQKTKENGYEASEYGLEEINRLFLH